jgi:hypothetical protein
LANFFYSVGYPAENVHSGMIAYLCNLWNEGKRADEVLSHMSPVLVDEAKAIVNHPVVDSLLNLDPPLETILAQHERGALKGT